jgi:hypothetical protein
MPHAPDLPYARGSEAARAASARALVAQRICGILSPSPSDSVTRSTLLPALEGNEHDIRSRAQSPDGRIAGRRIAGRHNVGLVWAGNPGFYNDRNRSVALAALRPALESPGLTWFSLQKGEAARAQIAALGTEPLIHDFTADLHDFADTAALIMNLDLVITVDTAVAHLAGALGKPVWILVPANSEWRWLDKRTDSPWYPTARLFRQQVVGDWNGVVAELRDALADNAAQLNPDRP